MIRRILRTFGGPFASEAFPLGSNIQSAMDHPYRQFERSPVWGSVERSLALLVANGDLALSTPPEYVVGYICEQLGQDGVVQAGALKPRA
jgi:hypothetical protein